MCAQKFRFTDASTSSPTSSSVLNTPHNPHTDTKQQKNNPKPLARTAWRVQQLYNFAREPEHTFAFAQQHIVRVASSYRATAVAARPGDSFIAASERPSLCINYAPIPTSYGFAGVRAVHTRDGATNEKTPTSHATSNKYTHKHTERIRCAIPRARVIVMDLFGTPNAKEESNIKAAGTHATRSRVSSRTWSPYRCNNVFYLHVYSVYRFIVFGVCALARASASALEQRRSNTLCTNIYSVCLYECRTLCLCIHATQMRL